MAKHKVEHNIQGFGKKELNAGDVVDVNPTDEAGAELVRLGALTPLEGKSKVPTEAEITRAEADEALRLAKEAKA